MARNANLCHPPKTTPILRRADKGVYAPLPLAASTEDVLAFLRSGLSVPAPTPKRRRRSS